MSIMSSLKLKVSDFSAILLVTFVTISGSNLAHAQSTDPVADCKLQDSNGSTSEMICKNAREMIELKDEGMKALRAAGTSACVDREPCIVWIWDDPANAPVKSPPLSDGLTKAQVQSAVAVWVNDANEMLMISAEAKK